jgi:hypothetical protein
MMRLYLRSFFLHWTPALWLRVEEVCERKMKKQERERDRERICDLCKQQVFIRERRPEKDPWPSE